MSRAAHAIVLGASISGLLTARVLADRFERVTLVERDGLPEGPEHRRGVPQGQQIHGLLASGAEILEQLFPGFSAEFLEAGGVAGEMTQRGRVYLNGHRLVRYPSELRSLQGSRPFLEGHVRRRVRALANVEFLEEHEALGLATSDVGDRVIGARVRQISDGREQVVDGDLVVDATGRGSRSPRWLEEIGFDPPAEERVQVDVRYMTRLYRRGSSELDEQQLIAIAPSPPISRGGGAIAIEGDRWMVTIFDYFGQRLPTEHAGFQQFAASLAAPDLAHLLEVAEPCSDEAVPASYPASQRRRYDRLARFPDGYLVVGDALCSFNPIYGQGMSVAAIEAAALQECLDSGTADLAQRFFKQAASALDVPWTIAVGSDLRFDGVEGRRTPLSRALNWYIDRLFRAAEVETAAAHAFITVNNLQAPPSTLVRPGTVAQVARGNLRGSRRG